MKHMKNILNKSYPLFILVIAALLLFIISCSEKSDKKGLSVAVQKEVWTCSMHPEIIRDHAGSCPICGMDLVRKTENATAISGIKLDELLQPTNRYVISSLPLTGITNKRVEPVIEALGTINYDMRLINTISARVSGRIDKLYVHYRYQHVMKGERIMDIYSPELLTAQQELLFLIKNDAENSSLIYASKQKLLLLGMNEGQLQQVIHSQKPALTFSVYSNYSGHLHEAGNTMPEVSNESVNMGSSTTEELPVKEGMYIQQGQIIFQLFNTDKSWALLNIFPEVQSLVKVGNKVKLIPETDSGKAFEAKIDFIEPFFRNKSKTLTARVYFDNMNLRIPTGSQVKATVFCDVITANWLPERAVISLGMGKVVFLQKAGGFMAHKIQTGLVYKNEVEILAGLSPGDSVATNAQYLADSEGFIKTNQQQ